MSLSRTLAAWSAGFRADALPEQVFESARLRLLDSIGCMIGGAGHPDTLACGRVAAALFPGAQTRSVPLPGATSLAGAALINGAAALVLEFDDSHLESAVHPTSPVVAAALALAEVRRLPAADLLAAVAIGTELACRLGLAAVGKFHQNGFHPTAVFGTFGAAYAAARCLGLDAERTIHAAGVAGSLSAGLMASWQDGSGAKSLHAGFAAGAALTAAFCAENGVTGPDAAFEGRFGFFRAHVQDAGFPFDFARVAAGLGAEWEMLKIAPKAYPCGHYIQPLVEAALALRRRHAIVPERIVAIRCLMPAHVMLLVAEPEAEKRRPNTPFHARFSLQHTLAEAMLSGRLDKASFQPENLADPRINALADKVTPVVDPGAVDRSRLGGQVEIALDDGSRLSFTVEHMRGMPLNPMSACDVADKFRLNAAGAMPERQAGRLIEAVLSLRPDSDVSALFALL